MYRCIIIKEIHLVSPPFLNISRHLSTNIYNSLSLFDESLLPVGSVISNVPLTVPPEAEIYSTSISDLHIERLEPLRRRQVLDYYKRLARHCVSIPKLTAWNPIELQKSIDALCVFGDFREGKTFRLSFALFQRIIEEKNAQLSTDNHPPTVGNNNEKLLSALIEIWKKASTGRLENIMSPTKLLHKLQDLSFTVPNFQIPPSSLDEIWKVAESDRDPNVAQTLLFATLSLGFEDIDRYYKKTLQKWAQSGHPDTSRHLDKLVRRMRKKNIRPSIICYNILIRYHANKGSMAPIQDLLQSIQNDGLNLQRTTLAQVLFGFAKNNELQKAEDMLWQIVRITPENVREQRMYAEGVQNILLAYRRCFESKRHDKNRLKERMETFLQRVQSVDHLTKRDKAVMWGTVMDIRARLGDHEGVDLVAQQLVQLNAVQMALLIKSYGMRNQPFRALELLKNAAEKGEIETCMFNSMMHAWTVSSDRNPFQRSLSVLQMLKDHPNCAKLAIQPNIITFHSMLVALAKSKVNNVKDQIEFIFNEMSSITRPTVLTFSLAIKASICCHDLDYAFSLLHRMKNYGLKPNAILFSSFLNHFSSAGSRSAAEQAENILSEMTKNSIIPDNHSFNAVITAWSRSGDSEAAQRIWAIYLALKKELKLTYVNYVTLLSFFGKSDDLENLLKADELLQCMERDCLKPKHIAYSSVVGGWLCIGKPDQAARVLLRQFADRSRSFRSKADSLLVDSVVQGFLKRDDIEKAHSLIVKIEELKRDGASIRSPTTETYESLLENWKTSKLSARTERIQEIEQILASSRDGSFASSDDDDVCSQNQIVSSD